MEKFIDTRAQASGIRSSFLPGVVVFLCAVLFSALHCNGAANVRTKPGVVIINPDQRQRIEIMGGDMERSGSFVQKAANTPEILKWAVRDIPFNFFRVQYDKHQEMTEGEKDWSCYDAQIKTMQGIRQLNPNIKFLATLRSDYHGYSQGNCNNFPTYIYDYKGKKDANGKRSSEGSKSFDAPRYGIFLADYVEYMHRRGVPIDFISTAKEYTGVITVERSHEAYETMARELKKRRVPVPKAIGPASWGIPAGIKYVKEVDKNNYQKEYAAFSTHNLGRQPHLWNAFGEACAEAGEKGFNDESGAGAGGPTYGKEPELSKLLKTYREKIPMYQSGMIGEIFFEIWSRGIKRETRTIYFGKNEDGTRMRSYYAMKYFTHSALGNYFCASSTGSLPGLSSMAFRDGSTMHLWLINESDQPRPELNILVERETIYHDFEHHCWSLDIIQPDKRVIANKRANQIAVDIPAVSLNYIRFKTKLR